jgi:hypothetical protein
MELARRRGMHRWVVDRATARSKARGVVVRFSPRFRRHDWAMTTTTTPHARCFFVSGADPRQCNAIEHGAEMTSRFVFPTSSAALTLVRRWPWFRRHRRARPICGVLVRVLGREWHRDGLDLDGGQEGDGESRPTEREQAWELARRQCVVKQAGGVPSGYDDPAHGAL